MSEAGNARILNKNIFWKRFGDPSKPTLVLLHGLGRSMEQWRFVVEELSKHFDVFLFDLVGYGASDDFEPAEINVSFPIWLMDELFAKFKIERPILLGESFGGLLALEYTLKRQQNVGKLVLMDSAGLGREISIRYRIATIPIVGEAIVLEDHRNAGHEGINFKDPYAVPRMVFNLIRFAYLRLFKPGDPNRILTRSDFNNLRLLRYGVGIFGQKYTIRRERQLKRIKIPTLIMHGLEDKIFPSYQAVRAYEQLPNPWGNGPVFFKEGKHFPLGDRADEVLDYVNIRKFLDIVVEFGLSE